MLRLMKALEEKEQKPQEGWKQQENKQENFDEYQDNLSKAI